MPGAVLVLAAMAVIHTGSALSTELFDDIGVGGTTWLRVTFAALLLLACTEFGPAVSRRVRAAAWASRGGTGGRPPGDRSTGRSLWRALREAPGRDLVAVVLLGAVSGAMMLLYAESADRIPLGTATALEFLGPLAVAVAALSRRRELTWLLLAVGGVLCLTSPWQSGADLAGVLFGLGSGACWALYVIGTQHVGSRFKAQHGLALSLTVAAVVTAPFGAPGVLSGTPDWRPIAAVAGIAVLMPLVPFLLEMLALQRIGRTAYGTLAGLEPAVSLLAAMVLIAQTPTALQAAGTVLVVIAGIGAARGGNRTATDTDTDAGTEVTRRPSSTPSCPTAPSP